jgi:ABC-type lipoprotein release transport system permease subunit
LLALLCLGVGAAVTLVAVLATWLPARRAAGVSPITALRVG